MSLHLTTWSIIWGGGEVKESSAAEGEQNQRGNRNNQNEWRKAGRGGRYKSSREKVA